MSTHCYNNSINTQNFWRRNDHKEIFFSPFCKKKKNIKKQKLFEVATEKKIAYNVSRKK